MVGGLAADLQDVNLSLRSHSRLGQHPREDLRSDQPRAGAGHEDPPWRKRPHREFVELLVLLQGLFEVGPGANELRRIQEDHVGGVFERQMRRWLD